MPPLIPADLIIQNVLVITMNPLAPFAKGIAISDGKIAGLLYDKDEKWPLVPNGQYIDGKGMTMMPGLIDAHCHLRAQISCDLSVACGRKEVRNIPDIINAIQKRAEQLPAGLWIRATGYDPFYQTDQRHPTRWDLDKATTAHPVRLRHVTRHASVLNSKALALAGIGRDTPDPPGVTVVRERETGTPTGLVYGGDAWLSRYVIPPLAESDLQFGTKQLQTMLLSKGITAVQEATPTNTVGDLQFWAHRMAAEWCIPIQLMADEERHEQMVNFFDKELSGFFSRRLEMGPVKVVMEALPHLWPEPAELSRLAARTVNRGSSLAIHVVNPEMVWAAIEAIQSVEKMSADRNIRHRLEHLSLCPEAFLPDMAELGMMVVTNPTLVHDHGDRYLADVDASEHKWLYRMNSLRSAGISLAAGSDAPVASFDPWIGIQTACSRKTSSGKVMNQSEKLTRWQALELYTSGAALAAGWETFRGQIRPGFQANIIALNQNPLTCPVEALHNIDVCATWIDGHLVYKRE